MSSLEQPLARRVLVVEDEFLIALEMVRELELRGVQVIGPLSNLEDALDAAEHEKLDGALLDVNLRGKLIFPAAAALARRGIPFIFATSYGSDIIPAEFADAPRYMKPVDPLILAARVASLSNRAATAAPAPALA